MSPRSTEALLSPYTLGDLKLKNRVVTAPLTRTRAFHFDEIHHRGQISTYLRPMGAKVLSIYGSSGDAALP
jgi:2,4-dienoyl-CoA reductase-like NADH-dependent reductase (Old Yellow Enzyme family)